MNSIENFIEPKRLLISWQPSGENSRARRIVAIIEKTDFGTTFRYLTESNDFIQARQEGFEGFPAFKVECKEFRERVLDAFIRRLPPRKREDFADYLKQYRLPNTFAGSDMALLAYTGAKLPSDGFEIFPDMEGIAPPFELVMEVAGFRYQNICKESLSIGDPVRFVPEPDNAVDPNAIGIFHALGRIGYTTKPYSSVASQWLKDASIEACIERINGKPERPLVYLFVKVSTRLP